MKGRLGSKGCVCVCFVVLHLWHRSVGWGVGGVGGWGVVPGKQPFRTIHALAPHVGDLAYAPPPTPTHKRLPHRRIMPLHLPCPPPPHTKRLTHSSAQSASPQSAAAPQRSHCSGGWWWCGQQTRQRLAMLRRWQSTGVGGVAHVRTASNVQVVLAGGTGNGRWGADGRPRPPCTARPP